MIPDFKTNPQNSDISRLKYVQLTGPTIIEPETFESKVFHTLWELKKEGYADTSIKTTNTRLRYLAKHCDLDNPESVKSYIASKECTMAYKQGLVDCYDRYVRVHGLSWDKPYFRREDPVIQLPTEERINKIISSCQAKNALQFSMRAHHNQSQSIPSIAE